MSLAATITQGVSAITGTIAGVISGKQQLDAQADADRYSSASEARAMHENRMNRAAEKDNTNYTLPIIMGVFALILVVVILGKK